ncbi:MAG TPA: winged helix-turn-helix transcriptional regulator [Candidatus Bathyarchaeia archaeon]|nr:winged helix-turn-helix transcriptional regulator [Candidatus Bathyarchaeia archaeon]
MNELDHKIFCELLKNSRVSDRQMARNLGTSQPTITRRRSNVEKKLIEGYTVIPKWQEIGYEIVVFTFIKGDRGVRKPVVFDETLRKVRDWFSKEPNVIFAATGEGLGFDGVMVSFHKCYSDYADFKKKHDKELSNFSAESQSFIVDINSPIALKPFHLKYLTDAK